MKYTLIASLLTAASAFNMAPVAKPVSMALNSEIVPSEPDAGLNKLAIAANPVVKFYDPIGLSEQNFWGDTNEATIGFLRHAEIKHGRVAMAAFVGYCVQSNFHWPWAMTRAGDSFPSIDLSPEAQWDAIPEAAKWQILVVISFLELWGEQSGVDGVKHYMRGGQPGKYPSFDLFSRTVHPVPFDLYDPFRLNTNMSPELKEKRLVMEINNEKNFFDGE